MGRLHPPVPNLSRPDKNPTPYVIRHAGKKPSRAFRVSFLAARFRLGKWGNSPLFSMAPVCQAGQPKCLFSRRSSRPSGIASHCPARRTVAVRRRVPILVTPRLALRPRTGCRAGNHRGLPAFPGEGGCRYRDGRGPGLRRSRCQGRGLRVAGYSRLPI